MSSYSAEETAGQCYKCPLTTTSFAVTVRNMINCTRPDRTVDRSRFSSNTAMSTSNRPRRISVHRALTESVPFLFDSLGSLVGISFSFSIY